MHNVYLFQPQYTTFINGKINNWLPYSVGAIWSYAAQFKDITDNFDLKDLIFKREELDSLLNRLESPRVCGFSCYLWNRQYCLTVAEAIKNRWPECTIIFGGPEVSARMTKYQFIDCILIGEGEENFVDILRNVLHGRDPDLFSPKKRLQELDIPSPYLTGVFDKILADNPEVVWAVTIETNRGCPYSCTFCDWGSLTYSKVKKFNLEKISAELAWLVDKPIAYIYIADANFGMYKQRDIEIAKLLRTAVDNPTVELVSVQAAKNNTEIAFQIGQILGPKYTGVTVSVQSMNDETLSLIKRKNMPTNNIAQLLDLAVKYNVPTYTEMILGMPHETKESWCQGMTDLLEIGQHNSIEMWFTQLLENSELAQPESRKLYGIKSIKSKNYISMRGSLDKDGILEETEIVCETNTMSTADMIESYMYGWMIVQLHIPGYSQIISKYLRYAQNISYREFYDSLLPAILSSELMAPEYYRVKQLVETFLTTGIIDSNVTGHLLYGTSNNWMYENKQAVMDFVYRSALKLSTIPNWVVTLQNQFIYDANTEYPLEILADYNIIKKIPDPVIYKVESKLSNKVDNYSLATIRRKGVLKNTIKEYVND